MSADDDIMNCRPKLQNLKATIGDDFNGTNFWDHIDTKLIPVMKKYVMDPIRNKKASYMWTNNNCESVNHIIKCAAKWRVSSLPKFISTIYEIIISEV